MLDRDPRPGAPHPPLPGGQLTRRLRGERPVGPGGGGVQPLHVLPDHPPGQHLRTEVGEGLADHLDPAVGQPVPAPLVEAGRDPVLQQVVQRRRLQLVAPVVVGGGAVRRGYGPAEVGLVPLVPPAVPHRQVEAAVERRLHPAGAARLQRPQRVVQPHVAAGVELLRHRHAVVGQEDDAVPHPGVVGEPDQLLDQPLAAVVRGVRLARDDDLHRPLRMEQQLHQPVPVAQHQREPLVRGDAAGEADGQHVRVEDVVDPAELGRAGAALPPGGVQPRPHLQHQLLAQHPAQLPDVLVGDVRDRVPAVGAAHGHGVLGALRPDLPGAEPDHLGRHPGRRVHPVGDGGDRHLLGVESRPQSGEHLPADLAVQQRDPVGPLPEPEPHHGHVEQVGLAPGVALHPQVEDAVDVDAGQFGAGAEVPGDQLAVEAVDAGRDGGVRGEHRAGADGLQGGVEVEPGVGQLGDPLQAEEPGVPLVGVEDLRCGVAGEPAVRAHRADTPYAEQHLLEQPVLAAAAVEPVGDVALAEVVLLDVGVEQEQRNSADPGQPDPGGQPAPAGQREGDVARRAVLLGERGEGQLVRVEHRIVLLLPAVAGEGLAEVAVPVEQADADQRDAQVAGGLEVVAGQDAEAAGVLRQRGRDAEFRREVGDRGRQLGRLCLALVPAVAARVVGEVVGGGGQPAQEPAVPGQLGQARGRDAAQEPHGVAAHGGPPFGVHGPEEITGLGLPRPAQITGEVAQRLEGVGEYGTDGEPADGLQESHLHQGRTRLRGALCVRPSSLTTVTAPTAGQPRRGAARCVSTAHGAKKTHRILRPHPPLPPPPAPGRVLPRASMRFHARSRPSAPVRAPPLRQNSAASRTWPTRPGLNVDIRVSS